MTAATKTSTKWELLARPFDADAIRWLPQSIVGPDFKKAAKTSGKYPDGCKAKFLAYANARDVMDRLDSVLGVDGWSDSYVVLLDAPWTVECSLTVDVGKPITKTDVGYSNDPENDKAKNEPAKAAYSDALKRAAVKFGVGRFLYDMPDTGWVAVDKYGKPTVSITAHESVCAAGEQMLDVIRGEQKAAGVSDADLAALLDSDYQVTALEHLSMAQAKNLIGALNKPRGTGESAAAKAKPAAAKPEIDPALKEELMQVIGVAKEAGHTDDLKAFLADFGGPNPKAWASMPIEDRENAAAIACGSLPEGAVA